MLATVNVFFKHTLSDVFSRPVDVAAHERLRLRLLFGIAIMKLFNFMGGAWDIQWHVAIGRDSLFIAPHLVIMAAFFGGLALALFMMARETGLAAYGQALPNTIRLGKVHTTWPIFFILCGYTAALLSGLFDEWWHDTFGIDSTLWSPPHLMIMASTMFVDFNLLFGISATARRLGYHFTWKSPYLAGILLAGAYAFESANFQMGEALIVGYRHQGAGLYGLLFPLMLGAVLPFSLMACLRLSQRYWIGILILGITVCMQLIATAIAGAGFAILKPVSVIEGYVRENPDSTIAVTRTFAHALGNNGIIGFHQAWTMTLAAPAMMLVALLGLIPTMRRHPLWVAPIFSASFVIFTFIWFKLTPALQNYPIGWLDVLLAVIISSAVGCITGTVGWRLALRSEKPV